MPYLATTNTTFPRSISSQPILHCYALSRYSQILHYCMILWYNNNNTNKIYSTTDTITVNTMIILTQQQIMPLYITWYNTRYEIWIQKPIAFLSMNKATTRPLLEDPHRCAHQERLGGRHATIQDYEFCVIILFFSVLPFVLLDICLSEDT